MATLAVKSFAKHRSNIMILLRIDNTTVVAYINNLGGTVSSDLVHLTRKLNVVPGEEHTYNSTVPSWIPEHDRRCGVSDSH